MKIGEIRALLHAQPFVPFTIHLADGGALRISHPDFVATSPRSDSIIVYRDDDTFHVVDLSLATDLHVGAPA